MINVKKISKTGSVTIPAPLRRRLGIMAGDTLKLKKAKMVLYLKEVVGIVYFVVQI